MLRMFSLNGFATGHSIGAGASFIPNYDRGISLTYRISYPLDGLKIPTHRFGVQFRLPPPAPLFPDIKPLGWKIDGKPIPGETLNVALAIKNIGNFRAPETPIAIKIDDDDVRKISASPLLPAEIDTVKFKIFPQKPGDYKIVAVANREKPDLSAPPKFIEKDPNNNSTQTSIHIFAPPKAELKIEKGELHLLQLFSVAEDEPLVPLFFFNSEDTILDKRFRHTIDIVASRLHKNPDVKIIIRGYVIDGEDTSLALSRAKSVRSALIAAEPDIASRIKISRNYDYFKKRAKREKFQGTRLGGKYTAQENRRVELSASIDDNTFDIANDSLPSSLIVNKIQSILSRNSEVILAVRASDIPAALKYKQKLLGVLGDDFSSKIFSQEREGNDSGISLVLSAAGLIYRPPQVVQPQEGYEIEQGWDRVGLSIKTYSEVPIAHSKIFITSDDDTVSAFLGDSADWDWKLPDGNIPPPGAQFFAHAVVEDTFGQTAETEREKLAVLVKNINEVEQRLILLQFAFAGDHSESEFTNARMEYIAKRVIERIEAGDVDVVIAGHTDTIGTFSGNQKLSQNRADEQMTILRKYLRSLLDKNDEQLDEWMTEHNTSIVAVGYGMSQPFTITRLRDDEEIPVMVGNNTLPEGRIKNRRVEILFAPKNKT